MMGEKFLNMIMCRMVLIIDYPFHLITLGILYKSFKQAHIEWVLEWRKNKNG